MQEKQVTWVLHTTTLSFPNHGNPEPSGAGGDLPPSRGTLDRFMMKMMVGYPGRADENEIPRGGLQKD
ncbi:MAG: hypothetical protein Ct9H90mP24_0370 [Methanobacteriota archaeon]|nr:MAG: hypothetical protein Ct9H90mP24_0370 [Euryarchaeota archaeon]